MDLTITIPDTAVPEVVDALCASGDWTAAKGARNAYAKQVLIDYLKRITINYRVAAAAQAATSTATATAQTDLSGVT